MISGSGLKYTNEIESELLWSDPGYYLKYKANKALSLRSMLACLEWIKNVVKLTEKYVL